MVVLMITILAAAIALPSFVLLELGDCGEGRLPVNSGASVPRDSER